MPLQNKVVNIVRSTSPLVMMLSVCLMLGCEDTSQPSPPQDSERDASPTPELDAMMSPSDREPPTQRAGSEAGESMGGENMAGESMAGESGVESGMMMSGAEAGGEEAGGEEAGGEEAGGEEAGGEQGGAPAPVSCARSCLEFAECAIAECPGYDEPDVELLLEECLAVCTPAIAELFNRVTGCDKKMMFAFTVRTDFMDFCDSVSAGFCETYLATCNTWRGETECEDHYNLAPREGAVPNRGANQLCYEYHLGSAMVALDNDDPEGVRLGCERAAGLEMCVDE